MIGDARRGWKHLTKASRVTFSWSPPLPRLCSRCYEPVEFAPWSHQEEAEVEEAVQSIDPDSICMKLRLLDRVVL